ARGQVPLVPRFALLPVGALFLSASRGGILAFAAEIAFLILLIVLRRREKKVFFTAAIVLALGFSVVWWLGIGRALERFASYKSLEVGEARRVEMLHGTWHIFLDHPVVGTGLGTLQEFYPRYETLYDGLIVNHSHNDYAEALAETGAIGGLCCFAFLALLFWNSWRLLAADEDKRNFAYHVGALVACV